MKHGLKTLLLPALIGLALCTSACEFTAAEGDWEPMKWTSTVKKSADTNGREYVSVPKEGGTYVFICKNYGGFWLSDAKATQNGATVSYVTGGEEKTDDDAWTHISAVWADVRASGRYLTVVFQPNDSGMERTFSVTVTGGDIFDYFNFKQSAN